MTFAGRAIAGLLLILSGIAAAAAAASSAAAAASARTGPAIESIGVFYDVNAPFGQRAESLSVIRRDEDGYAYETYSRGLGLASLLIASNALETTRFSLDNSRQVTPREYLCRSCDSRSNTLEEIAYDWQVGLATHTDKEEMSLFDLVPRAMDRKAWEIQTMLDLGAGLGLAVQPTLESGKLKLYNTLLLGHETLNTPAGEMETVKYHRQREGSDNFQYIWYARELGWLPAKWEIWRKDKRTFIIEAANYAWGEEAALAMRQDWLEK